MPKPLMYTLCEITLECYMKVLIHLGILDKSNVGPTENEMKIYKVTYLDYIQAENEEQAKDILLEQLSMDVRRDDASAFGIEEDANASSAWNNADD